MDDDDGPSQDDVVAAWRIEQREDVGFDTATSIQLAMLPYLDLERARRLRRSGATLVQIAEILS